MTKLDPVYEYNKGYIILRLPMIPDLTPTLVLNDRTYIAKPNLHCSFVAVKKLASQLQERDHLTPEAAEQRALEVVTTAINRHKPQFLNYLNELRLADKPNEDKHTLIVMTSVSGLREVFAEINHELGLHQPVQPTHVTLYTVENELPIGATSPQELHQWTRPLDAATRQALTSQLDPHQSFGWNSFTLTAKLPKHYTAGAIILTDSKPTKVLLVHHKKLGAWLQPGGHQEADENSLEAVIREAKEETGINISPYLEKITPINEHASNIPLPNYILEERIPKHKGEPDHYYIDMLYVVRLPEQSTRHQPEESHAIGWFTLEQVENLDTFEELRQTLRKEMK